MQCKILLQLLIFLVYIKSFYMTNYAESYDSGRIDKISKCDDKQLLKKRIICFYRVEDEFRPYDLDPCLCTHVIYSYVAVRENYAFIAGKKGDLKFLAALKQQNPNLKILVSLRPSNNQLLLEDIDKSNTSASAVRTKFAQRVREFITRHGLDGVDLDWEYFKEAQKQITKRDTLVSVLRILDNILKPLNESLEESHHLLTITTSKYARDLADYYDFSEIYKSVDFVNVPAFNFDAQPNTVNHPSRLHGLTDMENMDSMIDLVLALGLPQEQLVVGMPAHGTLYKLLNTSLTGPGSPAIPWNNEEVIISHSKICAVRDNANWTLVRDKDLTAPYMHYKDKWIGFDDEISIKLKAKYIVLRQLGGVALYSLNDDDYSGKCGYGPFPLLQSIRSVFLKPIDNINYYVTNTTQESNRDSPENSFVAVIEKYGNVERVTEEGSDDSQLSCPHTGYIRHPNDCTKFYRCIKFNQNDENSEKFQYNCPIGLVFDERYELCNYPSWSPPCLGSGEIVTTPKKRFVCPSYGYFQDPENCEYFYYCSDFGKMYLQSYQMKCPFDLAFDEEKLVCNWKWLVRGCPPVNPDEQVVKDLPQLLNQNSGNEESVDESSDKLMERSDYIDVDQNFPLFNYENSNQNINTNTNTNPDRKEGSKFRKITQYMSYMTKWVADLGNRLKSMWFTKMDSRADKPNGWLSRVNHYMPKLQKKRQSYGSNTNKNKRFSINPRNPPYLTDPLVSIPMLELRPETQRLRKNANKVRAQPLRKMPLNLNSGPNRFRPNPSNPLSLSGFQDPSDLFQFSSITKTVQKLQEIIPLRNAKNRNRNNEKTMEPLGMPSNVVRVTRLPETSTEKSSRRPQNNGNNKNRLKTKFHFPTVEPLVIETLEELEFPQYMPPGHALHHMPGSKKSQQQRYNGGITSHTEVLHFSPEELNLDKLKIDSKSQIKAPELTKDKDVNQKAVKQTNNYPNSNLEKDFNQMQIDFHNIDAKLLDSLKYTIGENNNNKNEFQTIHFANNPKQEIKVNVNKNSKPQVIQKPKSEDKLPQINHNIHNIPENIQKNIGNPQMQEWFQYLTDASKISDIYQLPIQLPNTQRIPQRPRIQTQKLNANSNERQRIPEPLHNHPYQPHQRPMQVPGPQGTVQQHPPQQAQSPQLQIAAKQKPSQSQQRQRDHYHKLQQQPVPKLSIPMNQIPYESHLSPHLPKPDIQQYIQYSVPDIKIEPVPLHKNPPQHQHQSQAQHQHQSQAQHQRQNQNQAQHQHQTQHQIPHQPQQPQQPQQQQNAYQTDRQREPQTVDLRPQPSKRPVIAGPGIDSKPKPVINLPDIPDFESTKIGFKDNKANKATIRVQPNAHHSVHTNNAIPNVNSQQVHRGNGLNDKRNKNVGQRPKAPELSETSHKKLKDQLDTSATINEQYASEHMPNQRFNYNKINANKISSTQDIRQKTRTKSSQTLGDLYKEPDKSQLLMVPVSDEYSGGQLYSLDKITKEYPNLFPESLFSDHKSEVLAEKTTTRPRILFSAPSTPPTLGPSVNDEYIMLMLNNENDKHNDSSKSIHEIYKKTDGKLYNLETESSKTLVALVPKTQTTPKPVLYESISNLVSFNVTQPPVVIKLEIPRPKSDVFQSIVQKVRDEWLSAPYAQQPYQTLPPYQVIRKDYQNYQNIYPQTYESTTAHPIIPFNYQTIPVTNSHHLSQASFDTQKQTMPVIPASIYDSLQNLLAQNQWTQYESPVETPITTSTTTTTTTTTTTPEPTTSTTTTTTPTPVILEHIPIYNNGYNVNNHTNGMSWPQNAMPWYQQVVPAYSAPVNPYQSIQTYPQVQMGSNYPYYPIQSGYAYPSPNIQQPSNVFQPQFLSHNLSANNWYDFYVNEMNQQNSQNSKESEPQTYETPTTYTTTTTTTTTTPTPTTTQTITMRTSESPIPSTEATQRPVPKVRNRPSFSRRTSTTKRPKTTTEDIKPENPTENPYDIQRTKDNEEKPQIQVFIVDGDNEPEQYKSGQSVNTRPASHQMDITGQTPDVKVVYIDGSKEDAKQTLYSNVDKKEDPKEEPKQQQQQQQPQQPQQPQQSQQPQQPQQQYGLRKDVTQTNRDNYNLQYDRHEYQFGTDGHNYEPYPSFTEPNEPKVEPIKAELQITKDIEYEDEPEISSVAKDEVKSQEHIQNTPAPKVHTPEPHYNPQTNPYPGHRNITDNSIPESACTRPGLFQHPYDCNKYYECYWDKYINKFTLHSFECAVKLAFDSRIVGCGLPNDPTICVQY